MDLRTDPYRRGHTFNPAFEQLVDHAKSMGQRVEFHVGEPSGPKGLERSYMTAIQTSRFDKPNVAIAHVPVDGSLDEAASQMLALLRS